MATTDSPAALAGVCATSQAIARHLRLAQRSSLGELLHYTPVPVGQFWAKLTGQVSVQHIVVPIVEKLVDGISECVTTRLLLSICYA